LSVAPQRTDDAFQAHASRALHEHQIGRQELRGERLDGGLRVVDELGQKARFPSQICETARLATHADDQARGMTDGGLGDGVVLARGQVAELAHLAEHDDEGARLPPGDGGGGLEPGDHRSAVRVVGVVEDQRPGSGGHEAQPPLIVVVRERVERAGEQLWGDGIVRERAEGGDGGERGEDPGFAEQRRRHDELLAAEQIAGQRERGAVAGRRDLADDPEAVPTAPVRQPLSGGRAGQLGAGAIVISIDDRDLAGSHQERALFVSDLVDIAEPFGVSGGYQRQDADIGRGDLRESGDFAGTARPELDDTDLVALLQPQ
jgi:hypothetical protein